MSLPPQLVSGNLTLDAVNKAVVAINNAIAQASNPGTVTAVSVTTANGVSGTVANPNTTPAITLTVGTVGGVSVTGTATPTLAVTGTTAVSGSNTGDQTLSGLGAAALATSQAFTGGQACNSSALAIASNLTAVTLANNNNFSLALTADTTLSNPTDISTHIGQSGRIVLTQGNGAYSVAYGSYYYFPGGTTPTNSSTTGDVDILYYDVISATMIACNLVLAFAS